MSTDVQQLEVEGGRRREAWARRRPAWTRTDTTRWLNERSATVLAWLRRADPQAPTHSRAMGRWLQAERGRFFARAHDRLAACGRDEARREKLNVLEVLS